jgi:hypothetical protein
LDRIAANDECGGNLRRFRIRCRCCTWSYRNHCHRTTSQLGRKRRQSAKLTRQADTGRTLVEEVEAQQELQPLDLCADGRLRHAHQLRRLGNHAMRVKT